MAADVKGEHNDHLLTFNYWLAPITRYRRPMLNFFLKSSRRNILAIILTAVLVIWPTISFSAGQTMTICYPDFWPFFHEEDGKMTGFFYDIVTEALNRMDIQATWKSFPWPRCQEQVKNGDSDAMITVPTAARLQYSSTHLEPFYEKQLSIFTYVGHPRLKQIQSIKTIDDILKLNLVVITYTGNGWNDRHIKKRGIKTYETPKLKNVWRMLANKRGDIAIEWPGSAWPDIEATSMNNMIIQTDVPLESMPFHLMIGKESRFASRLPEFNRIIHEMKKAGRLYQIVKHSLANPPLSATK